jgi:hypothetical protein
VARRRRLLAGAALVLVAVAVAAVVGWPHLQRYAGAAPPTQFVEPLDPSPVPQRPVFGVAHNAGNNLTTTRAALDHGAAVIEIDVVSVGGDPAAGRVRPWWWLAERVFRGPSLADAWAYAAGSRVIKLDLQQNDRELLDQVAAFVGSRPTSPSVMVSSRDPSALEYLRPRLPRATLLFSAAFLDAVQRVMSDATLRAAVDGISAFEGLVTGAFVSWAHRQHLLVVAWTVNDGRRLGQLLSAGDDGITTQNLAVLDALRSAS